MYFPIGWPKYLSVGQGRKSPLKCVVCNRYRMLFAVLTESTISIWHCKPCVEIVCYQRCHSSLAAVGTNQLAEWRQDSSMLAISTTGGYLLVFQLEQDVKGDKGVVLYEYNQTKTNQSDSNDAVPALRLTLKANVNYKVHITSLSSIHDELLVTLQDGRIELVSWEAVASHRKSFSICDIPFSVDMQLAGLHLKEKNVHPIQAVYSSFLEGFAVVLSDGRAALVAVSKSDSASLNGELSAEEMASLDWNAKGIWTPGLTQATCVAINNKYRLLGFGTKKGECCVYAIDDVTGCLVLSHTIALSSTHYPNVCNTVGAVRSISWSPDGCALALAWSSGGLSIWSVFGACLMCTLASDRAYSSDGTPNIQGVCKSMCWGVEGYHLWLISNSVTSRDASVGDTNNKDSLEKIPDVHIKSAEKKMTNFSKKFHKKATVKSSDTSKENSLPELGQLLQVQFIKSALAMNPCMSNHCHVLLHSEDRLYLSCGERPLKSLTPSPEKVNHFKKDVSLPHNNITEHCSHTVNGRPSLSPRRRSVPVSPSAAFTTFSNDEKLNSISEESPPDEDSDADEYESTVVGNKQWTVVQFPLNYLPSNWPIRFAAVDETCCFLAIAGNFGLAHYTVISRKWKVFGNVMQEKDMVVTGGLTWWEDFLVVACFNLSENRDEIRVYPRLTNLDNAFACIRKVRSQILLVNIFQNLLVLFTYDCRISIYVIARDPKLQRPMATLRLLQEISMARFVPYPTMVASVTMSALHMESATRRSSSSASFSSRPSRETEVIIVNVAGRLLLLQRSLGSDETPEVEMEDQLSNPIDEDRKQMRFASPIVLASCVENIWTTHHKNRAKVHLTDALWLGCGGAGVRVWLPLFPPRQNRHSSSEGANPRGFELQLLTARRITLAFSLDTCYPLALIFNEAVVLGVTSEALLYQGMEQKSNDKRSASHPPSTLPFSTIERTCEIYLHQILRQLLRRNLGYHAVQVAETCKNISCFAHVLELMLHEVLEEEATASEPIPDPLLPTVIKFLGGFEEYLQTVVHCARKTEIALWEYLFNSVGSPRELFEECLRNNQLRTAASYLIILQNLEQLSVARQDATRLFDQALQNHMWELANDIARFLRAIGDGDTNAAPRHPTLLNTNIYPAVAPASIHNTPTEQEPSIKFSNEERKERRKSLVKRQYSMAPSYLEKTVPPPINTSTPSFNPVRKLSSSRSCPSTPAIVVSFSGYNASSSKTQSGTSNDDYTASPSSSSNRRVSTRSFTESYLLPVSTTSTPPSTTGPNLNRSESLSSTFVPRYSVRQYHQDHPAHRPLQHSLSHPLGGSARPKRLQTERETTGSKERAAAECAEHYFIDYILARQARKMLGSRQLHKLGTFAAYVDFQLVPWLRKERSRAAKVDDPIACFKALHADFDWPYPALYVSKVTRTSQSKGGTPHSISFNDLQALQTNALGIPSSHSTGFNNTIPSGARVASGLPSPSRSASSPKRALAPADTASFVTDDDTGSGIFTVLTAKTSGSTLTLATEQSAVSEMSETSYTFDDSSLCATTEVVHGCMTSGFEVDSRRGQTRSEMELQYLLELFLEALCLEWAALICIMLKDPSFMLRLVCASRRKEHEWAEESLVPLDTLQRTRECLQQIEQWAVNEGAEGSGYKAVLINNRAPIASLYDVITAREVEHAEQQAILARRQRSGSTSHVSNQTINRSSSAEWGKTTSTNITSSTSTLPSSSVVKKRLFGHVPGSAVAMTTSNDPVFNGDTTSSSDDGLSNLNMPKPPRTRHNSVPCKNESPASSNETIHVRTPSSPAKINFMNSSAKESRTLHLDSQEVDEDDNLNVEDTNGIVETKHELTHTLPSSNSEDSHEDPSDYSASEDASDEEPEEESGCVVS